MSTKVDTYCGLTCENCEYKEKCNCGGCIATEGKPFHGGCEVAECAKKRKIRFCGECCDFPCELLKRYSFDKEQGDNGARIENCKRLKAALVKEAREGVDPISICGHHCDYCFMGQWCGGCRSNYNCCSYATIFPDGKCPNVSCSQEKGIDGCYECDELENCDKGYYGNENEYVAKATAMFIQKYGKDKYTVTLKNAIDHGTDYPKSFDATGSAINALALLESFISNK